MHIKRLFILLLIVVFVTGCGSSKEDKLSVITTVFPSYDFAKEIVGDQMSVDLLLDPGTDFHTFDPSPSDIIAIQESDVFIYIGTEVWVDTILDGLDTSKVKVIRLMDYVELSEELIVEGMEHDHEEDHNHEEEHDHEEDHDHEEEHDHEDHDHEEEHNHEHFDNSDLTTTELLAYDEHIWTSILNSIVFVEEITEAVIEVDETNKDLYTDNSTSYISELVALENEIDTMIDEASSNYLIIADRFPFTYFANDYDLDISAAFSGCSSATEASAQTIAFLIDKVNDESISNIFYLDGSNGSVADAIVSETGVSKLLLHSAHHITLDEFESGKGYIDYMRDNLDNLKEALN